MKKRCLWVVLAIVLSLCACGGQEAEPAAEAPTWQEQYDLGIRYLSEGNYEEAIIAFTAAIEIDPKQAEAYIGLADVYTAQGDTEKAAEVLNQALDVLGDHEAVRAAAAALESGTGANSVWWKEILQNLPVPPMKLNDVVSTQTYDDGDVSEYDAAGNAVRTTHYYDGGNGQIVKQVNHYYHNAAGNRMYRTRTGYQDDQCHFYVMETYDDTERLLEMQSYRVGSEHSQGSIERETYTYSGSVVAVDLAITLQDGTKLHWSHNYTLADPRNEATISGYKLGGSTSVDGTYLPKGDISADGTYPLDFAQITEHNYVTTGAILSTKYDSNGNVLETKSYT